MHSKVLNFIVHSFIVAIVLLVLVTPTHAAARDITPTSVLESTNEARVANGLPQLTMNEQLNAAARNKAQDIRVYGYWAHTNPVTLTTGWTFIQQAGYEYTNAGENLAKDYTSVQGVLRGWLNSSTHKSVLLSSRYSETGIGVVYYTQNGVEKALVVQLFAQPYVRQTAAASQSLSLALETLLAAIHL